jgi:hypothetical protein
MANCRQPVTQHQSLPMITYLNQIHFIKRLVASRLLNVENRDDVLMVEIPQQFHFSESSEAEHGVIKGSDLLDGDFLAGWLVYRGAVQSFDQQDDIPVKS